MNIKKIAEIANVSIATVSRVINQKPGVSAEIRKKVKDIVAQTNYRPNVMARGLVQKRSHVIGLMVPRFDGYYSDRVESILKVAHDNHYGVMIASALANYEDEVENLNLLYQKHVEGIIFFCAHVTEELKSALERISQKVPVVMVDYAIEELNIPSIIQDNYNGAKKAMQYLLQCGHRKIACITSPSIDIEGKKRYQAYLDVLKEAGIKVPKAYVREGVYSIESGCKELETILAEAKEMPTAVFACNDNMAIGAVNCIIRKGLRVPEDISVVGFDDIPIARHFNPTLTTVRQDQEAVGVQATELLLEMIKNKSVQVKKIILTQELIIRSSVRER